MFGIEHRQGRVVILRDRSEDERLEDAICCARIQAAVYGSDSVRILDAEGREIGIYLVEGQQDA